MAFTPERLLAYLEELGIKTHVIYHQAVMNVEEQANYVGHLEGGHSKNLFLKDKKHRMYLISALTTTNVDLKVLSQRLGLGKGGLRMAPEDAIKEVLKVPLGSVTPFALINESARPVSLLLDRSFLDKSQVSFHPLTNGATASLTTAGLDMFLRSIGREPVYTNLEEVVTVGKDHPPDLSVFVPSETSLKGQTGEELMKDATEKTPHILKETVISEVESLKISNGPQRIHAKAKVFNKESNSVRTTADPQRLVSYILDQATEAVVAEFTALGLDEKDAVVTSLGRIKNRLAPELQNVIMMFKNAAYTQGFVAGKANNSLS